MTKTNSTHHRLGRFTTIKRQQPTLASFFQYADGNRSAETLTSTQQNPHSRSSTKQSLKRQRLETPNEYTGNSSSSSNNNGSKFGYCPLCSNSYPLHKLEAHASSCSGPTIEPTTRSVPSSSGCIASLKHDCTSLSRKIPKPTCEPIPGLLVYEDFITEDEEAQILQGLDYEDSLPWKPATFNGKHYGKRWGVHCNLRDRRVDAPENPLPDVLQHIVLPKLRSLSPMMGCIPNEANAIDYRRQQGHWLKAHVDDRKLSKEPIANLSLAGDCYMTFQNQAMNRNLAVKEQKVLLKRRCLQILTSKARYDFSHAIARHDLLSDRRVSITMRESPLTVLTKSIKPISMWE